MKEQRLEEWASAPALVLVERVDRKDIVRFAVATGATDPAHFEVAAARRRGFADLVAPPLFYVALRTGVFNLMPFWELHEEGTPQRDAPPIPYLRAMAGETRAKLSRPFVAGREVTCSRSVHSIEQKQGRSGLLTFICFEYRYLDERGEPYVVEQFTRIFR